MFNEQSKSKNKGEINLEEVRENFHQQLAGKPELAKNKDKITEDELRRYIAKTLDDFCEENDIDLPQNDRATIVREISGAMVSLGPIRPLLEDKSISEIMINGYNNIYVQRSG